MSSSAPKLKLDPADRDPVAPYAYVDAGHSSGALGGAADGGQSIEERGHRQQAEFFEQGRQRARQELHSEFEAAIARHRDEISHALQTFAVERQSYYRRVEGEVVQLALAVARKIMHREVQIDPQTLAGIVRVTLEKLDTGTKVSLRVNPQEATDWRRYFACQVGDIPAPEVHEDPAIALGECRVETSLGATEVGLELQLKEIETGLLDLLAERPGSSSGASSATSLSGGPAATISTRQSPQSGAPTERR